MKRTYFLITGLVVAIIIAYVVWANLLKTAPSTSNRDTETQIAATDLYQAFETDEQKANELYLNKIIEVTGEVVSVDESEDLKPAISLRTEGFGVVKCTFETAEDFETSEITLGSQITIKGECIGYLLDVLLRNSIIIND